MSLVVADACVEEELKAQRRRSGADRYDEVWEGVYHMSPMAGDEHQQIVIRLAVILFNVVESAGLGDVRPGVNVSDREIGWQFNYRVPDVTVFLRDTSARNCETHWCGGPDFAVEICSPGDETRDKLPFYARVGTRELLLIDRAPWSLELYRLDQGRLVPVGVARLEQEQPGSAGLKPASPLTSVVVPLTFRLAAEPGPGRPHIEVAMTDGSQHWRV